MASSFGKILFPISSIPQNFTSPSYYALLPDQLLLTTTSVNLTQHTAVTLQDYRYRFVKTGQKYLFGFEEHVLDGQKVLLAYPEKALIDMVQLHRSAHSTDRMAEVLSEHQNSIDIKRLLGYLSRSNLTTQRIFGLLFDALDFPYGKGLIESAQKGQATSRITKESDEYHTANVN